MGVLDRMEKKDIYKIKIIDCTIRDGGLINNFRFEDATVKNVFKTCIKAGVDYMEIGYKASEEYFSYKDFGIWKFCKEDDIKKILEIDKGNLKLSAMADIGRTNFKQDILPKEKSILDLIRVAAYIEQIDEALEMIKYISDKGYDTTLNLMAISRINPKVLNRAIELISKSNIKVIYIVDSFGALYTDDVKFLTEECLNYMKVQGKEVGIHVHNNRQMAFANTIEAIKSGATFLDATMAGLGRGAGNCALELIMGYLNFENYKMRSVIKCIQEYILPLKEKIRWGYDIPYMLTGQFNLHPKSAIPFFDDEMYPYKYVEFFDNIINMEGKNSVNDIKNLLNIF